MNNFWKARIKYRNNIRMAVSLILKAATACAVAFLIYAGVSYAISQRDAANEATASRNEAFALLNGSVFVAGNEKFRLATEQLPKLIGE